ncbi:hypothetical protein CONLIGDRAFT_683400 [Coniochaeta ligniaria NRRL 30616]|uniref:CFEM domain-containing protein n=1 Tax=Coniochaeta ligniaria NRRL 30616 TaxID=1408157 RepID=A0A1J7IZA7_9PEZI|nr:hypothetical protein CONLIGDRAFT_683400 [Coniochaeta ligniaria NRRL 30616]
MQCKIAVFAVFASLAAAQDPSQLPRCSQPCFQNAVADSGCDQRDTACLCSSSDYVDKVSDCIEGACNMEDL